MFRPFHIPLICQQIHGNLELKENILKGRRQQNILLLFEEKSCRYFSLKFLILYCEIIVYTALKQSMHSKIFILIYLNTYKGLAKTSSSFHCSRLLFDNSVLVITMRPSLLTYSGSHYMFSRLMETFCRYVLQMDVHQDVSMQTIHSSSGVGQH